MSMFKKEIRFRKLYEELSQGAFPFAIVSRSKTPWKIASMGVMGGDFVAIWNTYLRVDLLFFVISFDWESEGKKDKLGNYCEPY